MNFAHSAFSSLSRLLIAVAAALLFSACSSPPSEPQVVVYASVDQQHAEPILHDFQEKSGIRVLAVYDVESSKTTGLVNRLIAEKARPRADVFWSGEFVQTILLKDSGVLAPYRSPEADGIPSQYRDPDDHWTGFAGRARVILVNKKRLGDRPAPTSIFDFEQDRWPADEVAIALPLFGTTATHAAALYRQLGSDRARQFFETLQARGVQVLDGNATVRDQVASGRLLFGLTDTDDSCAAIERGAPVSAVFPDQDQMGTLIIPNTAALVANGPNQAQGRKFIDYLLSASTEARLVQMGWSHIPLRHAGTPSRCFDAVDVKGMDLSLGTIYTSLEASKQELREIFLR